MIQQNYQTYHQLLHLNNSKRNSKTHLQELLRRKSFNKNQIESFRKSTIIYRIINWYNQINLKFISWNRKWNKHQWEWRFRINLSLHREIISIKWMINQWRTINIGKRNLINGILIVKIVNMSSKVKLIKMKM